LSLRQAIERLGRRVLVTLLSLLLGSRRRPIELPESPRILVVRLDERVGNMLLLVPLLDTLRQRFPRARIDLLANARVQLLMERHPAIDSFIPFDKRAIFAPTGPLRAPFCLRRGRYDLAIDAANPTDPSTTQTILVRLSSARHTVGVAHAAFGRLYSAPVKLRDPEAHEIDLRLQLLAPVPGEALSRQVFLGELPMPSAEIGALAEDLGDTAVLNVGTRLTEKQLPPETYAAVAAELRGAGYHVLVTYGPTEKKLAEQVCVLDGNATLAPATSLVELAHLMRAAQRVVTCDTGPMHLAVAVGTPTCGIFVSTIPSRYGHGPPHIAIDARDDASGSWLVEVRGWLEGAAKRPAFDG
jgi:ADP-heptose:LPS heptosyltransferase